MNKTIIVNLFAGPGAGKSTTAAGVFHRLKTEGVNCELVTEYAKDVVWQGNVNTLKNQIYVFGKQHNRIFHLKDKVDVIVTDSPMIFSIVYCDCDNISDAFGELVMSEFNKDDIINTNYYINRVKPYNPKGRYQDEEGAKEVDTQVRDVLAEYHIDYNVVSGDNTAVDLISKDVLRLLEKNR